MNHVIEHYFDEIESQLLQSSIIISYQIVRREIGPIDGKLRLKATLKDGGFMELFEYVTESNGVIQTAKYSFHWQNEVGKLKKRWDNAPHFPNLPNPPHHVHLEDGTVHEMFTIPNMLYVIEQIEESIEKG